MRVRAVLLLAGMSCLTAVAVTSAQPKLVADFKKLGGIAKMDKNAPGMPIVQLTLSSDKVTDASLAPLKDLTSMTKLVISSPKVTDAGLTGLKGMTKLQELDLHGTPLTD